MIDSIGLKDKLILQMEFTGSILLNSEQENQSRNWKGKNFLTIYYTNMIVIWSDIKYLLPLADAPILFIGFGDDNYVYGRTGSRILSDCKSKTYVILVYMVGLIWLRVYVSLPKSMIEADKDDVGVLRNTGKVEKFPASLLYSDVADIRVE